MNIVVVMRQVPDLIEPLEIDDSGRALDLEDASFLVNESDDHALEQAILLKERAGGTVTVVGLDHGEIDNTFYTAVAKGADRVVKIACEEGSLPAGGALAKMFAAVVRPLEAELVLVGSQAHDELTGALGPVLATELAMPYLGVVRGVEAGTGPGTATALKEFPGAVKARMSVDLPAVLGILAADQPPRYVPVSRIRGAMKSATFEETETPVPEVESGVAVARLYFPEKGEHAEMLEGSEEEVAERIAELLVEKGVVK